MSGDEAGMLEYWSGPSQDYSFPKTVKFEYKTDTDLYEFVKVRLSLHSLWFVTTQDLKATLYSRNLNDIVLYLHYVVLYKNFAGVQAIKIPNSQCMKTLCKAPLPGLHAPLLQ